MRPDFYLIIKHNRKQDNFSLQSYKWTWYYYLHYLIIQWPNEVKITQDMFEVHLMSSSSQIREVSNLEIVVELYLLFFSAEKIQIENSQSMPKKANKSFLL